MEVLLVFETSLDAPFTNPLESIGCARVRLL